MPRFFRWYDEDSPACPPPITTESKISTPCTTPRSWLLFQEVLRGLLGLLRGLGDGVVDDPDDQLGVVDHRTCPQCGSATCRALGSRSCASADWP